MDVLYMIFKSLVKKMHHFIWIKISKRCLPVEAMYCCSYRVNILVAVIPYFACVGWSVVCFQNELSINNLMMAIEIYKGMSS